MIKDISMVRMIIVIMPEDISHEKKLRETYEKTIYQLEKLLIEIKQIESNLPPEALPPEIKAKRDSLYYSLIEPQRREASYAMSARIVKKDELDELEQKVNIIKKLKF